MKPEKIKNKCILEIVEIFENDTGTRKAIFRLIENSPVDDNELARNIFAAAKKRRPTNTKLKNVGFKYKDELANGAEVVSYIKSENNDAKKVDSTDETKVEEAKNLGGEPFKKGSFHLNRLGEVCELLEDYTFNGNISVYNRLIIKMFNWNQFILINKTIVIYFNPNHIDKLKEYIFETSWTNEEYYDGDSESTILASKKDFLELGNSCNCKGFIEEYDLLLVNNTVAYKPNVKKGILPDIDAIDNSTSLKNIKNKISKIKTQKTLLNDFAKELNIPNLKGNFDEVVSQLTEEFILKNNCDIEGQVKIENQIYKPSIYSKDNLIKFCKDRNLLLTKDSIMSLSRLKESKYYRQLVDSAYILFIPDIYQQNLMLIKLCVELEKYSAAEDTLKLMKDDEVLYRISPKDAGGNFWYVYKCDEAFKKNKSDESKQLSNQNTPM